MAGIKKAHFLSSLKKSSSCRMNVFGKISRSSRLSVVFPLDEAPLMPNTNVFVPESIIVQ